MSLRFLRVPSPDVVSICRQHWHSAELARRVAPSEAADRICAAQRMAYEQARSGRMVLQ